MPHSPIAGVHNRHRTTGYALTLFILGATVGLLALLGRLAHELHAALLNRLPAPGGIARPAPGEVAPLLAEIGSSGALVIAAGFVLSTLCLLAGALLWRHAGHPVTRRERIWGRFAHAIALLLWLGMGAAALVPAPDVRIALLVACGGAALALLAAFVYLLVEYQFLASAPPLPDERDSRPEDAAGPER